MDRQTLYKSFLAGVFFLGVGTIAFFQSTACFAQNVYLGPSTSNTSAKLIKVQVETYDEPKLGGVKIQNVSFGGRQIPLKPADISGFRGGAGLQMPPGSYDLIWETTQEAQVAWPRTVKHQQKVKVSTRDSWIQIVIRGPTASVG